MSDENRATEVVNEAPVFAPEPITHERLQGEFEYLSVVRFAKKLLKDGKITLDDLNGGICCRNRENRPRTSTC